MWKYKLFIFTDRLKSTLNIIILQSPKTTSQFGKYYVESLVPLLSIYKTHQINVAHTETSW